MNEWRRTSLVNLWLFVRNVHLWTSQPLHPEELRAKERSEFIKWLLDEGSIAKRKGKRGRRQKEFFRGNYQCLQGKWPFRKSDFTQRLYVGFQALVKVAENPKEAYYDLLKLPSVANRLGRSRKGRRSKREIPTSERQVETIRSLCNKFKSPFKDKLLETRVGEYRLFQLHQFGVHDCEGFTVHMRFLNAHPELVTFQDPEYTRLAKQMRKLISDEPPRLTGKAYILLCDADTGFYTPRLLPRTTPVARISRAMKEIGTKADPNLHNACTKTPV